LNQIIALALLAGGATLSDAGADATLGIETTGASAQAPQVTRAYLQQDKLKIEIASGTTPQEIIFRGDLGQLWIVDRAARSYRTVDRKQMQAMGQQMDAALKSLESDLDRLPPAERKRVEQLMLGEKPSLAESATTEFRKTDRQDTIDGFPCIGYDYYRGGEKVGEAWLASWDAIGVDRQTFAVFESFQEFLKPAGSGSALKRGLRADLANLSRLDGFPLVIRDVKDSKVVSESRMRIIDRGSVASDQFEVPSGFTEQALPPIPGGGK
jgi:hypothetical protein